MYGYSYSIIMHEYVDAYCIIWAHAPVDVGSWYCVSKYVA